MAGRRRPNRVCLASYAIQAGAFGGAAAAAFVTAPVAVVAGLCAVGFAAISFVRPAGAVLVPAIVRSSRELTVASLWTGSCDTLSVLVGPFVALVLLALEGPAVVLAGCAALALASFVVGLPLLHTDPPPTGQPSVARPRPLLLAARSIRALRRRPGTGAIVAVAAAQEVLSGALDLIFVVLAVETLDLGAAGAGLLSWAFGVGAPVSTIAATMLVRRSRLAPMLTVALAVVAIGASTLGMVTTLASALLILPIIGCSRLLMTMMTRILLQRSLPSEELGPMFGVLELLSGLGKLAGCLAAQLVLATADVEATFVVIGVFFAFLVATTWRPLRLADDSADVPVVAVSLLRRLPLFAPLPPIPLESSGSQRRRDPGQRRRGRGVRG